MRILHFSPYFKPDVGGMETFNSHLVAGLQSRGHQNLVIASHKDGTLPDESQVDGVTVHRLEYVEPLYRKDLSTVLRSRKRAEHIKRDFQPEVVVVHVGGVLALLYQMTASTAPSALVSIAYDLAPIGVPSQTLQQLFDQSRHVIAISRARLEDARFIAPAAASRMTVIYPCVPWRELHAGVKPSGAPLVLMAGRLDPAKGFDVAVEAFRRVHDEIPEARLVLVGHGPVYYVLKDLVRRLDLEEAVRVAGYLSTSDLTRLYQEAWVSLVPSRHSESFGLVALEAMHAACPVVATNTGGLAEIVVDGETGYLIPVDDVGALAERILALLRDRPLGLRMGLAGQRRAAALFDWDTCLSEYERILHAAVKAGREGRVPAQ